MVFDTFLPQFDKSTLELEQKQLCDSCQPMFAHLSHLSLMYNIIWNHVTKEPVLRSFLYATSLPPNSNTICSIMTFTQNTIQNTWPRTGSTKYLCMTLVRKGLLFCNDQKHTKFTMTFRPAPDWVKTDRCKTLLPHVLRSSNNPPPEILTSAQHETFSVLYFYLSTMPLSVWDSSPNVNGKMTDNTELFCYSTWYNI